MLSSGKLPPRRWRIVSRSVVPQPMPMPRIRVLAEMPRQIIGGGAAQRDRDVVGIGRGRNDHGVLEAGLGDQAPFERDAVGQPRIDLDVHQAAFARLGQQAIGTQPGDPELGCDIGLGQPFHEIEPGHAHPQLLVFVGHRPSHTPKHLYRILYKCSPD